MKRIFSALFLSLLCLLWLTKTAIAADISNPILKKLVEKGILTKEEAVSVMQEIEKEAAEKAKKIEEKIEKKVAEVTPEDNKDIGNLIKILKGFKFSGLWYLSYQNGTAGNTTGGEGFSRFDIKRGYLTVEKELLPWFRGRITTDITTVNDPTSNLDGSLAVRIKYLYGQFNLPEVVFLTKPFIEVGVVHMPWLDYEEHTNFYRMQDTMFLEKNGIFNSADIGITFTSLFGGLMNEDYQNKVNSYYPGRYGSMSAGIYNGGGYTASEKNENKVLEGRLTIRPLPDIIPGLQLSYFGLTGEGNKATNPDWTVNLGSASFEHEYMVLTGQYYWGKSNQKGDDENNKRGYSFFAELKPHKKFSIISRYDFFDPNIDIKNDENRRYIAGIAYHIDKQHKNMILIDYDTVNFKEQGKSNDKRAQGTLQVAF